MAPPVLGIDLGTSNTCVAVMLDGQPRVVTDERGRSTTPSVLSLNRNNKFIVGHVAKAQLISNPFGTIHSAKRLLGQPFRSPDVQRALQYLPYNVVEGADGMPLCEIGGRRLSPTEVSAATLKKVKRLTEKALGEQVHEAVITVPAHFNNAQRQATKAAAERAGLEVLRLINEPTAAALAYGFGQENFSRRIAVYDFGGGTFDISVLEIGDDIYEVLSTGGDSYLGGDDFNQRIATILTQQFKRDTGLDISFDKMAMQRVLDAAELAKVRLSQNEYTEVNLPRIAPNLDAGASLHAELSRRQVESACIDLVERSLEICDDTFAEARVRIEDLDELILVGGMTRMPLVRAMVAEYFGRPPVDEVNPDEVVAIGAAIQGGTLTNPDEEILLLDVTPLSLGIESMNGLFSKLIERNTKVPHRVSKIFTTSRDNQERVRISVYQGEHRNCSENTLLGQFELTNIPKAPRMVPKIEVTFRLDANGILNVIARDQESQSTRSIEIVDLAERAIESVLGSTTETPEDEDYDDYYDDPQPVGEGGSEPDPYDDDYDPYYDGPDLLD